MAEVCDVLPVYLQFLPSVYIITFLLQPHLSPRRQETQSPCYHWLWLWLWCGHWSVRCSGEASHNEVNNQFVLPEVGLGCT